jgi:hypothetical protein
MNASGGHVALHNQCRASKLSAVEFLTTIKRMTNATIALAVNFMMQPHARATVLAPKQ